MPVEVQFRGPALFVSKGNVVKDVRLPNAETRVLEDGGPANTHADGSKATKHYARLVILDRENSVVGRFNLLNTRVRLVDPLGGSCGACTSFDEVIDLRRLSDRKTSTGPQRLRVRDPEDAGSRNRFASVVEFVGGVIDANRPLPMMWDMVPIGSDAEAQKFRARVPILTIWRSQSTVAQIVIENRDGGLLSAIALDANRPKAVIYDFDSEWPSYDELVQVDEILDVGTHVDDDFKWVYQLLIPPGDDNLKTWLEEATATELPAPSADVKGEGARSPGSSGCFHGRIDDGSGG
ncbi:MAG: hypothetical protein ABIP93_00505 [Gemmatimonadaceae bacterium]